MVRLVTDSSADLPREIVDKYGISVVPLTIHLDGEEYMEGINLTATEFARRMFASRELPKTSQPSPVDFARVFDSLSREDEVLCLTISSGLSGTYQSACLGRDMCRGEVTVFDTLAGSLGHGLMVIKAAELAGQGFSAQSIIDELEPVRDRINILILLDTLENIVRGGRLNRFTGSIAKILDLKIILHNVRGEVELLEKVRGRKKFLKRALDIIGERRADFSTTDFGITHVDNLDDAQFLKDELTQRFSPRSVLINDMGATMGTYAGKGGMIVSF